jgi:hypothetical protein
LVSHGAKSNAEALNKDDCVKTVTAMYALVSNGDVDNLVANLFKKEMAEKLKTANPEELGDLGAVIIVTTMVKEKEAVVGFKDLKVTVTKLEGNKAEVKVEGMAASKMTIDGKEEVNERQITDNILLEKEDGKWKIVGVSGEKKSDNSLVSRGAQNTAAPAGGAVQDPEVISATALMYDHVSRGDVEKLTGELLKKEMAEKVKTANPEELGELGAVILVTTMVKEKKAVVGFKDLKVTVTKLEGDKAEVKVEGMAASKMTINGKEEVNEKNITDNILLEKEDGKWKIVGVSGEKKTETEVKPEVKPEGDAPKTEGEAPKTEGEPKADAPKTEGETK